MSLDKILRKKRLTVLGLNSGTSADGVDLALLGITSFGNKRTIKFLKGGRTAYPPAVRRKLLDLIDAKTISPDELIYLDSRLGQVFARAARSFLSRVPKSLTVDLVASHGQTVRHLPAKVRRMGKMLGGTMQLGSADFIAAATGKVVVSDFRQADIALGNEGAPITVSAMSELFASESESRLIVNIGGISNYFYFPVKGGPVRASDCGPGNSLCDILSMKLYHERFDRNGRHARRGEISTAIVERLMSVGFFRSRLVSTGRESFGVAASEKMLTLARQRRLNNDDVMATVSELTVKSILRKVVPLLRRDKRLTKLYLTGGGRHNIFFVDRLRHYLPGFEVLSIDALGIDGDYVEAAAYAVMGEACLHSRALPTVFVAKGGQREWPVLGKITQPPRTAGRLQDWD